MRNRIISVILPLTWLCFSGCKSKLGTSKIEEDRVDQLSLIQDLEKSSGYRHIYSDSTYFSFTGKGITIQNSLPKGGYAEPGVPYIDAAGREYFFVAFWTRFINQTEAALEAELRFSADLFPLFPKSDAYLKLLVPPEAMTPDRLTLYNYGLTGMKSFIDTNFNNTTTLERIIKPDEEHMFYTVGISYQAGGPARSEIIIRDQELFYRISMGSHDPLEIPCGKISPVVQESQQ